MSTTTIHLLIPPTSSAPWNTLSTTIAVAPQPSWPIANTTNTLIPNFGPVPLPSNGIWINGDFCAPLPFPTTVDWRYQTPTVYPSPSPSQLDEIQALRRRLAEVEEETRRLKEERKPGRSFKEDPDARIRSLDL